MDRLKNAAVLVRLVELMRERGSWCGETHIQKASYFLQELAGVPLGFEFVLYRHGPFSFDLRDFITSLRADGLLKLEPQSPPYGPRIAVAESAEYVLSLYSKTLEAFARHLAFVASEFGDKGVVELERLATAFYITRSTGREVKPEDRASQLSQLKPHIQVLDAVAAIRETDRIVAMAPSL